MIRFLYTLFLLLFGLKPRKSFLVDDRLVFSSKYGLRPCPAGGADITATTAATYLPEQWSTTINTVYAQEAIIPPLLDRRWQPEAVKRGDTINIPTFTESTSSSKRTTFGTGASLTMTAVTESQVQLLINQMAYKGFVVPMELTPQIYANYEAMLTEDIGTALAIQVDGELAGDNTNGFDAFTAIGTDNVDVTDDDIIAGELVLNNANAKLKNRFCVVSPATYASLKKIDLYRNSLYKDSGGNLSTDKGQGYLGRVHTLDFHMSNNLEAGTSGKKNFIGQQECIAFVIQKEPTIKTADVIQGNATQAGLSTEVAGFMTYGFKLVKSNHGRELAGK